MGCNIPRPWKRPPPDIVFMKRAINEPLASQDQIRKAAGLPERIELSDQPYGSKTNEAVLKAFDRFHEVAHNLAYHDTDLDRPIKEQRTNCPNCCAPITGAICEYCGTRFPERLQRYQLLRTTDNQEIIIPIYVGGEQIGEVVKRNNKTQFRSGGF